MINKVMLWVAKWSVGSKLLTGVDWVNGKLSGKRSEAIVLVQLVLWLGKHFGVIPAEQAAAADALALALLGALPVTLAEKVKKAREVLDKVVPEPSKP